MDLSSNGHICNCEETIGVKGELPDVAWRTDGSVGIDRRERSESNEGKTDDSSIPKNRV